MAMRGWKVFHLDMNTTILTRFIMETIYMLVL